MRSLQVSEPVGIERRINKRLPIRVMVEYTSTEDFLIDYTANMSIGGMFLQTDEPLELGTRFRLRFRIPERSKPIETFGVVRWVISPKESGPMVPGMGVQFDGLLPVDKKAVQQLLTQWEEKQAM